MVINIEKCIKEKIAIWCKTKKQANDIWKAYYKYVNKKPPSDYWNIANSNGVEVFLRLDCLPSYQGGYNKTYFTHSTKANFCIDYEDLLINKIIEVW